MKVTSSGVLEAEFGKALVDSRGCNERIFGLFYDIAVDLVSVRRRDDTEKYHTFPQ